MNIKDLTYSDHGGGYQRVHVIVNTKVKAITAAGEELFAAHAEFVTISRERTAAQGNPARFAEDARRAATEAGAAGGDASNAKKLRKKARAAEERLGDLDLEWEVAIANLQAKRSAYAAVVEHHAPALAAEARTNADAAVLALASATGIAREAESELSASLAALAALGRVQDGGEFVPTPPKARSGGMGGVPSAHVDEARTHLNTAIGYATEILDDLKADGRPAKGPADDSSDADDDGADDGADDEAIFA